MKRILALVALAGLLISVPLRAQQSQSAAPAKESAVANGTRPDQQLTEASKQAAAPQKSEADENAQFRQSPSIQWMARLLHISTEAAYWLAVVLNFAVVALLVLLGIKKTVPGMLRDRTSNIRKQIDEAQRASEDANKRLRDIESRLSQLGSEIAGFQRDAAAQQQNEENAFRTAMQEERERILAAARQDISSAGASAMRDLKAYAAELAVSLAEKKIKVDPATDKTLVKDFAEQLGRNGNA